MKFLYLFFLIYIIGLGNIYAETVKIALTDYPPYIHFSGKTPSGACVEIARAAFERVGLKPEFEEMSWQRGYNAVLKNTIHATMPYVKTKKREEDFLFSDVLIVTPYTFFYRVGNKKISPSFSWDTLSDFKDFNIGGTLGYFYIELFAKTGLKLDLDGSDDTNIKKLFHNRIDVFIISELTGWAMIKKMYPDKLNQFKTIKKPLAVEPMYLIVKKDAEGTYIIRKFNEGLRLLKTSGEYERILKKYTGNAG